MKDWSDEKLHKSYQQAIYWVDLYHSDWSLMREPWEKKVKRYGKELQKRGIKLPEVEDINTAYSPLEYV